MLLDGAVLAGRVHERHGSAAAARRRPAAAAAVARDQPPGRRVVVRRGGGQRRARRGRRTEHRVTAEVRRRRPGRPGRPRHRAGVVMRQVPVHAGPAGVVLGAGRRRGGRRREVEERGIVDGAERRETRRRDERARRPEHVRRLLALLPLGTTVLKPHLRRHTPHRRRRV